MWQQYVSYWHSVFTGDFGTSYAYYPSQVSTVLGQSMYWTLILVTICTVLGFLIGTSLGMLAGWKRGSWLDSLVPVTTFLSSIPYFWFAIIIVYVFAITLKWFPLSGGYAVTETIGLNTGFIGSAINYAVLPAVTITVASIGGWLIGMRNMMVTTLSEDYVRSPRAKGLPKRRVMYTYAARNAMLPSFSGFAMSLGFVIGGSIVHRGGLQLPRHRHGPVQGRPGRRLPADVGDLPAHHRPGAHRQPDRDIAYVFLDPRTRESDPWPCNPLPSPSRRRFRSSPSAPWARPTSGCACCAHR